MAKVSVTTVSRWQASRYEGYMVWINALIEGAGGHIVENPGAPGDQRKFGLASERASRPRP